MIRNRHEVESEIPRPGPAPGAGGGGMGGDSLSRTGPPKIRRQLERICEAIGIDYVDVTEMHIVPESLSVTLYDRNESGQRYRNSLGTVVMRHEMLQVDTSTFIGDEKDF